GNRARLAERRGPDREAPRGVEARARPPAPLLAARRSDETAQRKQGGGRMTINVRDLRKWKREGTKFTMLTCYDYSTARWLDRAGIPVLLVGDSLGTTMLGYPDTLSVTMDDMIRYAGAVVRGAPGALVVGDMPFMAYHAS